MRGEKHGVALHLTINNKGHAERMSNTVTARCELDWDPMLCQGSGHFHFSCSRPEAGVGEGHVESAVWG